MQTTQFHGPLSPFKKGPKFRGGGGDLKGAEVIGKVLRGVGTVKEVGALLRVAFLLIGYQLSGN